MESSPITFSFLIDKDLQGTDIYYDIKCFKIFISKDLFEIITNISNTTVIQNILKKCKIIDYKPGGFISYTYTPVYTTPIIGNVTSSNTNISVGYTTSVNNTNESINISQIDSVPFGFSISDISI